MMVKVLLIVIFACLSLAAQTQSELLGRYGRAVSQTYRVRPGVIVTATSAPDGQVCEMLISPELPTSLIKSSKSRLKSDVLTQLIDELVPVKSRGKSLGSSFLNMTCLPANDCAGVSDAYERVVIYRNGSQDEHRYATIQWKGATCERQRHSPIKD